MSTITLQKRGIYCEPYFFLKFIALKTPTLRDGNVMRNILKVDQKCSHFNFTSRNWEQILKRFFPFFSNFISFYQSDTYFQRFNLSDRVHSDEKSVLNTHCSVHGTNCRIAILTRFYSKWFSHRFKGTGLRYEIGISYHDRNIVWLHGPLTCELWPIIKCFIEKMFDLLVDNEKFVVNNSYKQL